MRIGDVIPSEVEGSLRRDADPEGNSPQRHGGHGGTQRKTRGATAVDPARPADCIRGHVQPPGSSKSRLSSDTVGRTPGASRLAGLAATAGSAGWGGSQETMRAPANGFGHRFRVRTAVLPGEIPPRGRFAPLVGMTAGRGRPKVDPARGDPRIVRGIESEGGPPGNRLNVAWFTPDRPKVDPARVARIWRFCRRVPTK